MKILVISDIHNDVENILTYVDKLGMIDFDVIVCPGDFTDVNIPKGFTKTDIGKLIIEELRSLGKPILAIPGNMDKEIIPLLEDEKISLHGNGKIIKGVGFYGFGGAKTPFNSPLEPEESEIRIGLENGFEKVKDAKIKVQVTHNPPARTKIDVAYTGAHLGSEVVRKFIEVKQPDVAISSHIQESRGTDLLGKTKLINSGRFPEGHCGLISIGKDGIEVKIINLI